MIYRPKEAPSCLSCPLYERGKPVYDRLPAAPTEGGRLLLIGELPGRDEVKQGVCFVGMSGKMLDQLFKVLEIPTPHITNSVKCGLAGGQKPTAKELKLASQCCKQLTDALIEELRPRVVMGLGNTALEHLTGLRGIEKYRGCCWEVSVEDTRIFDGEELKRTFRGHAYLATCSIHPAGILRQDERRIWIELLRDDLMKAHRLSTGEWDQWLPDVGDAQNVDELCEFMKACHRRGEMGVDVETTGLDALTCSLRTIGVGSAEKAYAIPWPAYFHGYWRGKDWRRVWKLLKKIFADKEMHLVFSNKIYDVSVLRQKRYFGDRLRAICDDALLRHHAVYPKLPHDLQSMSSQFLAVPPWKTEFQDAFGDWDDQSDRDDSKKASALFWYNACDVQTTCVVNDALKPLVVSHSVEKVYECDRRMVDIAIDWFRRGILIDMDEVRRLAGIYRSDDMMNPGLLDKLEASVQEYAREAGMPDFNPASPKQLGELLFKRLGLPASALTETGKLSTAKEQLYKIFHKHPIIPTLMKFRKESHLYSTYLIGLERKLHADGRLHSVGNITSTPSGRFGFAPAVQNWPTGKKAGEINMKKMMIATPGTLYVGGDFNALELRGVALLSGERRLINYFNQGADVHSIHAEAFFGAAFRNADAAGKKLLRDRGKPVTFGKNYGAGPDTLYETILPDRLDEDPKEVYREVCHMSEVFDGMYPMLAASGDYFVRFAQQNHNLRTMLTGRLRKFPMGGASDTVARNHPVQGLAGDIANDGTIRWVDALQRDGAYWKWIWPTLQIHDYLAAEVLEEHAVEEALRLEKELFTEITFASPVSGGTNTMKFPVNSFIGHTAAGWDSKDEEKRWLTLMK